METKTVTYMFFLNETEDSEGRNIAIMDGYSEGNKLALAHAGEIEVDRLDTDVDIAEALWRKFNIDHPTGYKNRSMCVGDVIVFFTDFGKPIAMTALSGGFGSVKFTDLGWQRQRSTVTYRAGTPENLFDLFGKNRPFVAPTVAQE